MYALTLYSMYSHAILHSVMAYMYECKDIHIFIITMYICITYVAS